MIKRITNKNILESLSIGIITILCFITFKSKIPTTTLIILSVGISIYFFPISLFINKSDNRQSNLMGIFSNLVICWITILSPIIFYTRDVVFIDYFVLFLIFANLFYVFYYLHVKNRRVIVHFAASLLVALFVII